MKANTFLLELAEFLRLAASVSLCALGIAAAQTQNYSIDWYTIDGGGGTSTGGAYSVSGTIGQTDAGCLNGDTYALESGFWGIFAIQVPSAPTLFILPAGL